VLAGIVTVALSEQLDLDLMAEVAKQSAAIRADFEARLKAAGLWS
jgi:hypothetical protein